MGGRSPVITHQRLRFTLIISRASFGERADERHSELEGEARPSAGEDQHVVRWYAVNG